MKKRNFSIALLVLVAFVFVLFIFNMLTVINIFEKRGRGLGEVGFEEELEVSLAPPYDHYRVFVSSQTYNGSLGGVSGANQKCQNLATNVVLGGNWSAWISDSTTSPSISFYQSILPYMLINNVTIANNWSDLTDGTLNNSINVNETGEIASVDYVWTGTGLDGVAFPPQKCNNWTSDSSLYNGLYGRTNFVNLDWTQAGTFPCDDLLHLYCFEQPWCGNGITESSNGESCDDGNANNGDTCKNDCTNNVCGDGFVYAGVEECDDGNNASGDGCSSSCVVEPHYRVFVSSQTYNGSLGGVSGANQKCQNLATNVVLGGNWSAWISDSTSSPASTFFKSTLPYMLINNVTIANNWSDLTDGNLSKSILINESGESIGSGPPTNNKVLTNTNINGGEYGPENCNNWTDSSNTQGSSTGDSRFTSASWTFSIFSGQFCDTQAHLYCFEQPSCGNNIIESSETCDDNNVINGDGCSSACVIETSPPPDNGGGGGGGGGGGTTTTTPQCKDKKDNDNDGKIDYPNDPGCTSANDTSEYNSQIVGCTEDWRCVPVGECVNGKQAVQCADINKCGTVVNKPASEENCEEPEITIETEDPDVLAFEKRRTLGSLLIILMAISTFIVALLIVSIIMRENNFLKQINSLSKTDAGSQTIEQKERIIEKAEAKRIPNVQVATFLVFVLSMIYYGVYSIALASSQVLLSPGAFTATFSISMLIFVLALIVLVLGGKKTFIKK